MNRAREIERNRENRENRMNRVREIEKIEIFRDLITKFLIPGLTSKLNNLLHDWLAASPINHPADYLIHGLIWELKIS